MGISVNEINNSTLNKRCDTPAFKAETKKPESEQAKKNEKTDEFLKKIENMSPTATGLTSAALWFGVGFGTDRLLGSAFKFFKTSMKSSLIWNGLFGIAMGIMAYIRARKNS